MPEPADNPYFDELLWVHGMIRRDLEAVRRLASEVIAGRPAAEVRGELADLREDGVLWQLKVNCLHYCRFVHHHHRLEDLAVFPALRRLDANIEPVLDRLETEHRSVATLLEQIEDQAERLDADERVRDRVASRLDELNDLLLAHLEFEEDQLERPMARMHGWGR
jgi:hypothetical protein